MKTIKLLEPTMYLGRMRAKGEFITVSNNFSVPHKEIKIDKKLKLKRLKAKKKNGKATKDKLSATI